MATVSPQFVIEGLMRRGYPSHVAQGFVMNMMDESGLNPGINEISPLVPGSRGGFGLYQLTGPRRTAYETFALQRGVDPSDAEAQLDFLDFELRGPESRAAKSILSTQNPQEAAAAIARDFLRPAPENLQKRLARYSGADVAADTMQALGKGKTMTPMVPTAAPQQERKGFLGGLLSDPDLMDRLAIGFAGMTLNPNVGLQQLAASRIASRAEERKSGRERNATAEWLRSQGRADLADGVMSGALPAATALQIAMDRPKDERTALMKNYEYARQTGYTGSFSDFLRAGGGGGSVVNVGGEQFKVVGDHVIMPDPTSPTGNRFVPIPGSKAALEAEAAAQRQGVSTRQGEQKETVVGSSIDYLIGKLDKGGLFDLPEAGVVGNLLGTLGVNQEAVDFRNELSTVQANIAFDRLQQMREASKTGGALGAVSERELDLLINAYGNLQQSTSPARLKENLAAIKRIMTKIENDPVASSYYYGQPASGQAAGGGFSVTGKVGN